jgi:hypothetical protein
MNMNNEHDESTLAEMQRLLLLKNNLNVFPAPNV